MLCLALPRSAQPRGCCCVIRGSSTWVDPSCRATRWNCPAILAARATPHCTRIPRECHGDSCNRSSGLVGGSNDRLCPRKHAEGALEHCAAYETPVNAKRQPAVSMYAIVYSECRIPSKRRLLFKASFIVRSLLKSISSTLWTGSRHRRGTSDSTRYIASTH